MKRILSIFILSYLFFSCSNEKKIVELDSNNVASNSNNELSEVSAKDGGQGFEQIAESEGYITNAGKEYGNPNSKQGGAFHSDFSDYPTVLRPYGPNTAVVIVRTIMDLVYGSTGLISFNTETNQWERGLATHWKFSEDNKTLWLRLNPDFKFSDGSILTTDDIIGTYGLLVSEDLADPMRTMQSKKYKLTKISPYILKIETETDEWKNWLYINNYILPYSYISKVDAKTYLEKYSNDFMPSLGPYVFDKEKSVDQEVVVLKRNPHWDRNIYPEFKNLYNFDSLEFIVIRDDKNRRESFKKGQIDILTLTPKNWYDDFSKKNPTFDAMKRNLVVKRVIFNDKPKGRKFFAFNTRISPFDNINVRKAIAVSIDKDIAIEKIAHNDEVKYFSITPLSPWGSSNVETYNYDPILASNLLDQAGYNIIDTDGIRKNAQGQRLEFEVSYFKDEANEQLHTILQENLKAVGIKVNLLKADFNTIVKNFDSRKFTMARIGFSGIPFPNFITELSSSLAQLPNNNNLSGFADKRVDELIKLYDHEMDISKRYDYIHEIDDIVSKSYVYIQTWIAPYSIRISHWNKFLTSGSYVSEDPIIYWSIDKEKEALLEKAKNDTNIVLEEGDLIVDRFNLKPKDFNIKEY